MQALSEHGIACVIGLIMEARSFTTEQAIIGSGMEIPASSFHEILLPTNVSHNHICFLENAISGGLYDTNWRYLAI